MNTGDPLGGRAWLAPLLIVPIIVTFSLWGPQVGMAVGAATAALVVVFAARAKVRDRIEVVGRDSGAPGGVLVLALTPIEDPRTAGIVATIADPSRPGASEEDTALVVAPAVSTRLDRWTSDLDRARFESQRVLTVSVATLIAAGLDARGRVGDEDPTQAVEDALRTYSATEVVVVAPKSVDAEAISELEQRLDPPLRLVVPD